MQKDDVWLGKNSSMKDNGKWMTYKMEEICFYINEWKAFNGKFCTIYQITQTGTKDQKSLNKSQKLIFPK